MQSEQLLARLLGEGDVALDVLHRQNGHARGDFAQNGHLGGGGLALHPDGAVQPGLPGDVAQALQGLQVGVDRGGGFQPRGGADFPHRGRHPRGGFLPEEVVHLLLAFCETVHTHAPLSARFFIEPL